MTNNSNDFNNLIKLLFEHSDDGILFLKKNPKMLEVRGFMGETLLHYCAVEGKKELVSALAGMGAQVNVKNVSGMTPLMECCMLGEREMAALLLSIGASATEKSDAEKRTAMHYAAEYGKRDCYNLLRDSGAREDEVDVYGETPKDLLINISVQPNQ